MSILAYSFCWHSSGIVKEKSAQIFICQFLWSLKDMLSNPSFSFSLDLYQKDPVYQ